MPIHSDCETTAALEWDSSSSLRFSHRVSIQRFHSTTSKGRVVECVATLVRSSKTENSCVITCKKTSLGREAGGLIHVTINECGWAAFMDRVQRVVNFWLMNHEFSVGIGDTDADPASRAANTKIPDETDKGVDVIHEKFFKSHLEGSESKGAGGEGKEG